MNENSALGKVVGAGLIGSAVYTREVSIERAQNGWIIKRYGELYVATTWNEATDKVRELFGLDAA